MRKKIARSLATVLMALIVSLTLGLSFYSYNAKMLHHDAFPMPFGVGVSMVLTGSMEPEFYAGDLIVVTKADEYALRDIVVFQSGQSAVVHRIVEIDGDTCVTQGDANNTADEPIELSAIKGRVAFSIPKVGYVVSFIKRPIGTILLLGCAILLFERSFSKEKQEHKDKLENIREEIEKLKAQQAQSNLPKQDNQEYQDNQNHS
jgi:signal peptidase